MANPVSVIDFTKTLATFLSEVVGDGTWDDILNALKYDNPGEEADATDIDAAAGQLWGNVIDDFFQATYPYFYLGTKTWRVADPATRDALGSDDGLAVNDVAFVESTKLLYYVVSVDGAAASTWAVLPFMSGVASDLGRVWEYDNATGDADPGAGKFRVDNANPDNATFIYINPTPKGTQDQTEVIKAFKYGDLLFVAQQDDGTKYQVYQVRARIEDGGGYFKIPVDAVTSGGAFDNATDAEFELFFTRYGDPERTWRFDTDTTDSDPGLGFFKVNNANPGNATFLYVDNASIATNMGPILRSLSEGDRVMAYQINDDSRFNTWIVTGTPTDGGGYVKIPVDSTAELSGAFYQNNEACELAFYYTGHGVTILEDEFSYGKFASFEFVFGANIWSNFTDESTPPDLGNLLIDMDTETSHLAYTWEFDAGSTADSDPGSPDFRFNNADPDLATFIYVHDSGFGGDVQDTLLLLGDGDHVELVVGLDPARHKLYELTGPAVNAVGYVKLPVTFVGGSAGDPADADKVQFFMHWTADEVFDADAIHDNVAGEIAALTNVTAASGDLVLIEDASDSNNKKRVTAQSIADLGGGVGGTFVQSTSTESSSIGSGSWTTVQTLAIVEDGDYLVIWSGEVDVPSSSSFRMRLAVDGSGETGTERPLVDHIEGPRAVHKRIAGLTNGEDVQLQVIRDSGGSSIAFRDRCFTAQRVN